LQRTPYYLLQTKQDISALIRNQPNKAKTNKQLTLIMKFTVGRLDKTCDLFCYGAPD